MVLEVLQNIGIILFVAVFFGFCIFIHEFGHMLTALWRGLHVERFSVGFGKKIWGFTRNNVEYVVSILPFGGYVALPQLEPTDAPESSTGQKLPLAKPFDKILTALSGPFFNVLFAIFLSLFLWYFGVYRPAPRENMEVVKFQDKDCPEYKAGLRLGDRITHVNGKPAQDRWQDMAERIALSTGQVTLTVKRDGRDEPIRIAYEPEPNPRADGVPYPYFRVRRTAEVHKVIPGDPAEEGGLKRGDIILAVNGETTRNPGHFIKQIRESEGEPLDIRVKRDGEEVFVENVSPEVETTEKGEKYRIGAMVKAPQVLKRLTPWQQFLDVYHRTAGTLNALFSSESPVKPRHMSGPVGILQMIWIKVTYGGLRAGLSFIILVSYSLAFFNLLPIPVLDGGHILFAGFELITRRSVPARFVHVLQNAFAILLITFMLYITFFDIRRAGIFLGIIDRDDDKKKTEEKQPSQKPPVDKEERKIEQGAPAENGEGP
mgnify:CR=1 FL=1